MTVPIFYKSSDAGAPAMVTTTPGTLAAVLDACLVTGYGSKPGAGWTIEYTAANRRVYRSPAGRRFYCDLDDRAVDSWPWLTGYINATGLSAGSNPYGSTAYYQRAAVWVIVADDRTFYSFHNNLSFAKFVAFGDFYSLKAGDNYNSICIGMGAHSSSTTDDFMTNSGRCGVARSQSGAVGAISMTCSCYSSSGGNQAGSGLVTWCAARWPFPNPSDSAVHFGRVAISSGTEGLRGYLRGIWAVPHLSSSFFSTDITDLSEIAGTGPFAGRNFVIIGQLAGPGNPACFAVESTAWDVSS